MLASDQVQFSLLYRKHEKEGLLAKAKELGVSVIAYSPLAQGMLTGLSLLLLCPSSFSILPLFPLFLCFPSSSALPFFLFCMLTGWPLLFFVFVNLTPLLAKERLAQGMLTGWTLLLLPFHPIFFFFFFARCVR